MDLAENGWSVIHAGLPHDLLDELRSGAFTSGSAGIRSLLDLPAVQTAAQEMKRHLIQQDMLPPSGVAVQAIAFDKTPGTNWKVPWHQDLMFPFAGEVTSPGYDLPAVKSGIHYARPPVQVLEEMLAVRLHLDDCTESNGPLRVSPGTHIHGIIPS